VPIYFHGSLALSRPIATTAKPYCHSPRDHRRERAGRQQGKQDVVNEASRASPAKQGEHQEYIDVLSLHRQSLQNKTVASNHSMFTCLLRATLSSRLLSVEIVKMRAELGATIGALYRYLDGFNLDKTAL
jgi:hypothetical protein